MQKREDIRQLFERYRQGLCTPEEQARMHAWFNRYAEHEASGLDELSARFEAEQTGTRRRAFRWVPYAAAIFLAAVAGTWLFYGDRITDRRPADGQAEIAETDDIQPGGNRATLTLADGRRIDLSESQAGIVVANGISYLDGSDVLSEPVSQTLTLTTPKGGTYQVTLPDGSDVWLNAASTLRYPSHFGPGARVVEIDGEGYFSVANDAQRPFKVVSHGQEIDVLGTEFNISAYRDDAETKTTLVEGMVRVSNLESKTAKLLSPGEQSAVRGATTETRRVEVEPYTAWKDGVFHFDNTPLEAMLRQLARWYEVDIVYESSAPKERFSGQLPRNVTMQTVLEMLRVSEIDYRLAGNTLIIK